MYINPDCGFLASPPPLFLDLFAALDRLLDLIWFLPFYPIIHCVFGMINIPIVPALFFWVWIQVLWFPVSVVQKCFFSVIVCFMLCLRYLLTVNRCSLEVSQVSAVSLVCNFYSIAMISVLIPLLWCLWVHPWRRACSTRSRKSMTTVINLVLARWTEKMSLPWPGLSNDL